MDLYLLSLPFRGLDIEWRTQHISVNQGKPWAMVLPYVTARAIQDRLDEVVGIPNWQTDYKILPGGVLGGIGIKINDEWVWKWDGAENTKIEAVKGGISGALKRAGVLWGIGRYLYNLNAEFVEGNPDPMAQGRYYEKGKNNNYPAFHWNPPQLPQWALPPDKEKMVYLHDRNLSIQWREYIRLNPLTDELKEKINKQLEK